MTLPVPGSTEGRSLADVAAGACVPSCIAEGQLLPVLVAAAGAAVTQARVLLTEEAQDLRVEGAGRAAARVTSVVPEATTVLYQLGCVAAVGTGGTVVAQSRAGVRAEPVELTRLSGRLVAFVTAASVVLAAGEGRGAVATAERPVEDPAVPLAKVRPSAQAPVALGPAGPAEAAVPTGKAGEVEGPTPLIPASVAWPLDPGSTVPQAVGEGVAE